MRSAAGWALRDQLTTNTTTYWFAVETRARAEHRAIAEIEALGEFQVYVPMETRLRRTRKGRVPVSHPLMSSIIFVGSTVPPIADVNSPDYPHPIFKLLKLPSVRALTRGAGGMVHPIQPITVDGWRQDFVENLRAREAAGEFDFTPRPPVEGQPRKVFKRGDLSDLMALARRTLFPDLALAA